MTQNVKRFVGKALLLIAPWVLLLALYLSFDPFKVVRAYASYYSSGDPSYVTLNFEMVATETFRRNYSTQRYDSFIFGNSRSRFYEVRDWKKHIDSTRCFHFDGSAESLFGLQAKFRFLDEQGVTIRHALIVLDSGTLAKTTNSEGHLFIKHPLLSGESKLRYQLTFFKAFLDVRFFTAYLYFRLTRQFPAYTAAGYLSDIPIDYDGDSNECGYGYFETMITRNPTEYYGSRTKIFYSRSQAESINSPVISGRAMELLQDIGRVLRKQQTDYHIVVSPLYEQVRINPSDLTTLKKVFGDANVHDFSGVNRFTREYTNYYETSHYRPQVAREIMDLIYPTTN